MNKNAGIYIRLSEMDNNIRFESQSESISSQRMILNDYVTKFGFNLVGEYIDEGYSGMNFNRPSFKRLMEDVKKGIIDTIIVKDLSRFGRDHIETGYYVEEYFPKNNIRFISILEKLDSALLDNYNDSITFVMACNDFYSQQNSMRIKIALRNKMKAGKYVGSRPCYGYMRDPKDRNHLIPDPETAPIVREIFSLALKGKLNPKIANIFNERKVPTPSEVRNYKNQVSNVWNANTIKNILENQIYTGDMVQSTQEVVSYKSKKKVEKPKKEWIIVENTHEPLVSKKDFNKIPKLRLLKNRINPNREKRLFENLLVCKDCGGNISISKDGRKNYICNCDYYNRKGTKYCVSHFIMYDKLEKELIDILINKKEIKTDQINRKKILKIIDYIFIDKDKHITIIMKNKKVYEYQYINDKLKRKLHA
ncbi:MAG: recombinase family protein [bacterium]|nr:recombinase family protein [bacterium]